MKCAICGRELTKDKFCPECQLNEEILKKVFIASRKLYNLALIKAEERDITTAISLTRKSLEFDKRFIEARNLLGLLYFRIGELGEAIREWKISYQFNGDENNKAYHYIKKVFNNNNKRKLEQIKSTIKMYNEALIHINQRSEDLAIIKLRKAVHINPSFLKANNLLSYCYLKTNNISKAMHYINNVLAVDSRNPVAIYYKESTLPQEENIEKQDKEEIIEKEINHFSKSTIFDNRKETGIAHLSQFVVFVLGLIIGGAAIVFLYTPDRLSSLNEEINKIKSTYEYKIEEKVSLLNEQQVEIDSLKDNIKDLENELKFATLSGTQLDAMDNLLISIQDYLAGDITKSANQLLSIDESKLTIKGKETYQVMKDNTYKTASYDVFIEARNLYDSKKYNEAITFFEKSIQFSDEEWFTEECYYKIARSYKELGLVDKAKQSFDIYFSKYNETGGWYKYAIGHYNNLQ